jgi:mRNA-degrading endonuclease RelE of RelBE toxin-antitoxin system
MNMQRGTVHNAMEIVETSVFTRQLLELLPDDEYRKLQVALANTPTLGAVIPRSGGIRKVRWALPGRGKRGGTRVIYYWAATRDTILMLFIFSKGERGDLSSRQLRDLRMVVEEEYG